MCVYMHVCRYSTGTKSLSCPGSHREQQSQPGPPANDNRQCYICGPVCRGQASSEKVRSCTSAAASPGCPLGSPQGLFLCLHNTCATLQTFRCAAPSGLVPTWRWHHRSTGCKEQSQKAPDEGKKVSHSWTQAEQNDRSPSEG